MDILRLELAASRKPLTQIAKEAGVNRATVSKIINSDNPKIEQFLKVAGAIDADPADLLREALMDGGGE